MSDFTKIAIMHSLIELLEEKEFTKITVKDIVTRCGINRNTFYYHFEDIYDLLRWMFDSEAVQIVQSFNLLMDYKDAIAFVIDYVEKNRKKGKKERKNGRKEEKEEA